MNRMMGIVLGLVMTSGMALAVGGNMAFQLGQKSLDADDWDPVDKQLMFIGHYDMPLGTMPFNLAFDLGLSTGTKTESSIDYTGTTTELSVGARKYFGTSLLFYGGAGLDFILAKWKAEGGGVTLDESGNGIGFYAGGGVLLPVSSFKMGLDLRYSSANADFDGTDVAVGGLCYSLVLALGM